VTIKISKTQIDRLGDRLKKGNITDDDLRVLDEYRLSFTDAMKLLLEFFGVSCCCNRPADQQSQPHPYRKSYAGKAFG